MEDDVEDEDTYEFAPVHATRRDKEKPSSSDTAPKHVTAIASRNVTTVLASEASASTHHFRHRFDTPRVIQHTLQHDGHAMPPQTKSFSDEDMQDMDYLSPSDTEISVQEHQEADKDTEFDKERGQIGTSNMELDQHDDIHLLEDEKLIASLVHQSIVHIIQSVSGVKEANFWQSLRNMNFTGEWDIMEDLEIKENSNDWSDISERDAAVIAQINEFQECDLSAESEDDSDVLFEDEDDGDTTTLERQKEDDVVIGDHDVQLQPDKQIEFEGAPTFNYVTAKCKQVWKC